MPDTRRKGLVRFALMAIKASDQPLPSWPATRLRQLVDDASWGLPAMLSRWSHGNVAAQVTLVAGPQNGWWTSGSTTAQLAALPGIPAVVGHAVALASLGPASYDVPIALFNVQVSSNHAGGMVSGIVHGVAVPGESRFTFCGACAALVEETGTHTRCSATGKAHWLTGGIYRLVATTSPSQGAPLFSRCSGCGVLVRAGSTIADACPAGGTHTPTAAVWTNGSGPGQSGWARCLLCDALIHGPSPVQAGACPRGPGGHQPGPSLTIPMVDTLSLTWLVHEVLHAIGLQHSRDTGLLGTGASPTAGDYGDRSDIMSAETVDRYVALAGVELTNIGPSLSLAARHREGWLPRNGVRVETMAGNTTRDATVDTLTGADFQNPALLVVVGPDAVYAIEQRRRHLEDAGLAQATLQLRRYGNRYVAGQPGWRKCTQCETLAFGGHHPCHAGGVHQLEDTDLGLAWDPDGAGPQQWRWCRRCSSLHRSTTLRRCPLGHKHDTSGSGSYAPRVDANGVWAECAGCGALYRTTAVGPCADATLHRPADTTRYALDRPGQAGWRACSRCHGLVHGGALRCPAPAGYHRFDDSPLSVEQGLPQRNTHELGWRWCQSCEALFSTAGPTPCPAGGNHAGGASGSYSVPFARIAAPTGPWSVCTTCGGIHDRSLASDCTTGAAHTLPSNASTLWFAPVSRDDATGMHLASSAAGEAGWRCCTTCAGLFRPDNGNGVCRTPSGVVQPHTPGTASYRVLDERHRATGQEWSGWSFARRCTRCLLLTDGTGQCPAGGAHVAATDVAGAAIPYAVLPNRPASFGRCTQCGVLAAGPGVCTAGSSHVLVGDYQPESYAADFVRLVDQSNVVGTVLRGEPRGDTMHRTGRLEVEILEYGSPSRLRLRMR